MVYPNPPLAQLPVLVTGATGAQGGAVVRGLLARQRPVRALVRNPDSPAARALREAGAELAVGDMDDPGSLVEAVQGVAGVFSVQVPDTRGNDSERRHGFALVNAAKSAGVSQFVHSSVTGTAGRLSFPRWDSGYWSQKYWNDKWAVEEAVRNAGFATWTVLRPAFMMDNFAQPKAAHLFPHLAQGQIATALFEGTRMQLIAAEDVGQFAAAAFSDPERFSLQDIDLAAQALTMGEVAQALSKATGRRVTAVALSPAQALERGLHAGWVRSQEWSNEVGYRADIAGLARWGVPLTMFDSWTERHRSTITIGR